MNENLETIDNESINNNGLVINNQMRQDLLTSAKWGKFLAIIGFIGLGFMIIGAFGMFAVGSNMPSNVPGFNPTLIALIYLAMAVLYFFPIYYLLQFSNKIKDAITTTNNMSMQEAFSFLARMYKYVGILTIVIIAIYFISISLLIGTIGSRGF